MADTFKVLGQSIPAAATLTDLYTVPALTQTSTSSLTVCNQGAAATLFRVTVAPAGAIDTPAHRQFFDVSIEPSETMAPVLGWTLATTDKVRVQSANGAVSFSLFGVEIT